jgi:hypothetical protein
MLEPKRLYLIVAVILFPTAAVLAGDEPATLCDFSKPDTANQWQTVKDGVMGGVSDGRFRITDKGIMEFLGTFSWKTTAASHPSDPRPRCWN